MKKRIPLLGMAVLFLIVLIILPGCLSNISKQDDGPETDESQTELTDITTESTAESEKDHVWRAEYESIEVAGKTFIVDENGFVSDLRKIIDKQKKREIFKGFSLAEYEKKDETGAGESKRYPVLYNEEYLLLFWDSGIELIMRESEESCIIEGSEKYWSINSGKIGSIMLDMNDDGYEDFVMLDLADGRGTAVGDVIDIHNKRIIPSEDAVKALSEIMPEFEVIEEKVSEIGGWEYITVKYVLHGREYTQTINMSDIETETNHMILCSDHCYHYITDDGMHYAKVSITFEGQLKAKHCCGVVTCNYEYDAEQEIFVLDADSLAIEFFE